MAQDAAPTPPGGVHTETSSHAVGDLVISHRVLLSDESLDPASTLARLNIDIKTATTPDGLPVEASVETDSDGAQITLYLDYSAADVLRGRVIDLCAELRAEATA
jgi:hypothetical protein